MIYIPDFDKGDHKFVCNQCQADITEQAKRALNTMKSSKGKPRWKRYFMAGVPDRLEYLRSQYTFKLFGRTVVITFFEPSDL